MTPDVGMSQEVGVAVGVIEGEGEKTTVRFVGVSSMLLTLHVHLGDLTSVCVAKTGGLTAGICT